MSGKSIDKRKIVSIQASEVKAKKIDWLWKNRFARGKLSLIAGDPGIGKSQVLINIISHITKGKTWPDNEISEPGGVIYLSGEDDLDDTVVPRLLAAGADCERVELIRGISCENSNELLGQVNLAEDIKLLERMLETKKDISAIFIDPISMFLGEKVDDYSELSVRFALNPIIKLAERYNIAIIGIKHLNKTEVKKAINRISGSIAYTAVSRSVFMVVKDTSSDRKRLFLPVKNNVGNDRTGLSFEVEGFELTSGILTSRVVWDSKTIDINIDDILLPIKSADDEIMQDAAEEFLDGALAEENIFVTELFEMAEKQKIAIIALRKAKKKLCIKSARKGFGRGGKIYWYFPVNKNKEPLMP